MLTQQIIILHWLCTDFWKRSFSGSRVVVLKVEHQRDLASWLQMKPTTSAFFEKWKNNQYAKIFSKLVCYHLSNHYSDWWWTAWYVVMLKISTTLWSEGQILGGFHNSLKNFNKLCWLWQPLLRRKRNYVASMMCKSWKKK